MKLSSKVFAVLFNLDGVLTDSEPLTLAPARLEAFPGAVELVRACKGAGLKVAVVSGGERVRTEATLRKIGLPPEQWDAIVTVEDAPQKTAAPDLFLLSAKKMGVSPEQCVVIEGSIDGVQGAKAAGMRCVAVARDFPEEQFRGADLVRRKIFDVSLSDLVAAGAQPSRDLDASQSADRPGSGAVREGSARGGPWGAWATAGLAMVIGLAFVVAQNVAGMVFGFVLMANGGGEILTDAKGFGANGLFVAVTTCGAAPVGIGATCFFAWLRRGISISEYLRFKAVPARELFRCCLALMAFAVLSDGLTALLGRPLVPDVVVESYRTAGFPPLLWLAVVVLAPLNEEIFFRGFLFAGFSRSRVGGWGAILLTSLLWAVIHVQYDWYDAGSIFAAGLLLGYVRRKTNSIIPTIAMHALMNLVATVQVTALIRNESGAN